MITEDQLKVVKIIFTMFWQSVFSVCMLIGWFIVLNKLLDAKTDFDAVKYGAVQTFLSATMVLAFRYWFSLKWREH
jgi:hypothetical protein